ncbi:hypothetical protein AB7W15_08910 [Morganella morganii]|uniref:hypothetical protein n=1 Tax=Morganella morganii TaxID=582 RepID=UPI0034E4C3C4
MNYRLLAYLNNELHGVWIDHVEERIHLHVKTSIPIIKSIWSGAPIKLVISQLTEKHLLVLGMIIVDNATSPYILAYPPREKSEIKGLESLLHLNYKQIYLSFYDANTMKVMDFVVDVKDSHKPYESDTYTLISGYKEGTEALELFFKSVLYDSDLQNTQNTIKFSLRIQSKKAYLSSIYEINDTKLEYDISYGANGSEGYDQENFAYHSLRQIFSSNEAFHSPNVMEGRKERELVDILISEGECILSIQSKASSLIEKGLNSHDKLCSMYKKKAFQGLNQVKGVIPKLKNDIIINNGDAEIFIGKKHNIYHLVLISDLVLDENSANEIFEEVDRLYKEKGAKVLVMSIEGLVNFVKVSRLHKELFWVNLESKFQFSLKNKTILIRDIDSSQEKNLPFIASDQYISHLRGEN